MDFAALARIHLREGAGGGDPGDGFCVMELVSFVSGDERATDEPSCASPFLTAFAIALNDSAPSDGFRDTMKPLALRLVNSRDASRERRRGAYLLRETAHSLLAPLLSESGLPAEAQRLREAMTRRALFRAASAAAAALGNAPRSMAQANARAGAVRLAQAAARGQAKAPRALRDAVHCLLTAPEHASGKLALWREAHAILATAIDLGAHGAALPQMAPGERGEAVPALQGT